MVSVLSRYAKTPLPPKRWKELPPPRKQKEVLRYFANLKSPEAQQRTDLIAGHERALSTANQHASRFRRDARGKTANNCYAAYRH